MSARKQCLKTPKMKEMELIEKIKSFWPDMVITEGHLKKPNQVFVYTFYSRFYREYMKRLNEIRSEMFNQEPDFDSNVCLDETSLVVVMKKICRQFDLNPFYLNDIYEPQPKRTILYFKICVNFLLFMHGDYIMDELSREVQKFREFQDSYNEKQNLLDEIKNLMLLKERLDGSTMNLTKKIENLSEEYQNVLKHKTKKELQHQEDIRSIAKLKENIQTLDEMMQKLSEDIALYQEEIVDKADVVLIKLKIDELDKDLEKLNIDRSEIVTVLESQEGTNSHFSECLQLLQNSNFGSEYLNHFKIKLENIMSVIQKIKRFSEDISNKKVEISNYKRENLKLMEEYQMLEQKLPEFEIEREEVIKNMKMEIEELQSDMELGACLQTDILEMGELLVNAKDELSNLEKSFSLEYNQLMDYFGNVYRLLQNSLLKWNMGGDSSN